ncbi:hypothetical protein B0H63DRAFT_552028 [Podospora didyma]|uniref:Uncharacterized protein n=1 Tax=Podospora didyma TaxID=330526 RepID=A0AAE0K5M2_9PEZI|nr:hypothetical protein B0H63DRAFT_552028 [Podospora didyma]
MPNEPRLATPADRETAIRRIAPHWNKAVRDKTAEIIRKYRWDMKNHGANTLVKNCRQRIESGVYPVPEYWLAIMAWSDGKISGSIENTLRELNAEEYLKMCAWIEGAQAPYTHPSWRQLLAAEASADLSMSGGLTMPKPRLPDENSRRPANSSPPSLSSPARGVDSRSLPAATDESSMLIDGDDDEAVPVPAPAGGGDLGQIRRQMQELDRSRTERQQAKERLADEMRQRASSDALTIANELEDIGSLVQAAKAKLAKSELQYEWLQTLDRRMAEFERFERETAKTLAQIQETLVRLEKIITETMMQRKNKEVVQLTSSSSTSAKILEREVPQPPLRPENTTTPRSVSLQNPLPKRPASAHYALSGSTFYGRTSRGSACSISSLVHPSNTPPQRSVSATTGTVHPSSAYAYYSDIYTPPTSGSGNNPPNTNRPSNPFTPRLPSGGDSFTTTPLTNPSASRSNASSAPHSNVSSARQPRSGGAATVQQHHHGNSRPSSPTGTPTTYPSNLNTGTSFRPINAPLGGGQNMSSSTLSFRRLPPRNISDPTLGGVTYSALSISSAAAATPPPQASGPSSSSAAAAAPPPQPGGLSSSSATAPQPPPQPSSSGGHRLPARPTLWATGSFPFQGGYRDNKRKEDDGRADDEQEAEEKDTVQPPGKRYKTEPAPAPAPTTTSHVSSDDQSLEEGEVIE